LRTACELADVKPGDLAAFVPHQANLRIVNALADALEAPDAVVARDVIEVGNTMAASIPIALSRMAARGEMPTGPILLFGFGSGLAYAGQVVRNLVIT
ncbi:MAG TPA: 3-oxoacyl-[acyl-carrier-protein] synthase III C-terminal domain-containing protein, partial [Micromonosporaceae bacterium]